MPLIWNLQASGIKRKAIAEELNRRQIPGPDGRSWTYDIVLKFLQQHRQYSDALQEHKAAAEAVAVLPLIRQLQMEGYDPGAIASRLQGKGTRWMWSKAAVEAVLGRAGETLAELPAPVSTAAAASDPAAVNEASSPKHDEHHNVISFASMSFKPRPRALNPLP